LPDAALVANLPASLDHLRSVLGDPAFAQCAAAGSAMELGDAVAYARAQIQLARNDAASPDSGRS